MSAITLPDVNSGESLVQYINRIIADKSIILSNNIKVSLAIKKFNSK